MYKMNYKKNKLKNQEDLIMNIVLLQGRVPFEPNFFEAKDDKKAFATFTLAVNTGVKDDESGYYKEDLFRCTASGGWAENLHKNWNNKMVIDVYGKLVMGKDYEKDGEIVKGQPELRVLSIHSYNTLDVTVVRAKIPNFENAIYFKEAEGDKKAFANVKLAISTGVKEGDYYKERIITAKAFGGTAEFLNKYYQNGDFITVEGKYVDGQDYEKDGEMVKAMPELIINNIHGFPRRKEGEDEGKSKSPAKKAPGIAKGAGAKTSGVGTKKLGGGLKKLGGLKKK